MHCHFREVMELTGWFSALCSFFFFSFSSCLFSGDLEGAVAGLEDISTKCTTSWLLAAPKCV